MCGWSAGVTNNNKSGGRRRFTPRSLSRLAVRCEDEQVSNNNTRITDMASLPVHLSCSYMNM